MTCLLVELSNWVDDVTRSGFAVVDDVIEHHDDNDNDNDDDDDDDDDVGIRCEQRSRNIAPPQCQGTNYTL